MSKLIKYFKYFFSGIIILILSLVALLYINKDKIVQIAIGELNQYLNTRVEVNPKIDLSIIKKFPEVSLHFYDVKIYESYPDADSLMAKANHIYTTFNLPNLLKGSVVINKIYIEDAQVFLREDKNGKSNYLIIKNDTIGSTSKSNDKIELNKITLLNTNIRYQNQKTNQDFKVYTPQLKASLLIEGQKINVQLKGDANVGTVSLNNIEYLSNKNMDIDLGFTVFSNENLFKITNSWFYIDQSKFYIDGYYQWKKTPYVDLTISNKKSDVNLLISLIPSNFKKYVSGYQSNGNIWFDTKINGVITETEFPKIDVRFGCKNVTLFHKRLNKKIYQLNCNAYYTNGLNKNASSSSIALKDVSFILDDELIKGSFKFADFKDPTLDLNIFGKLNLKSISELLVDNPFEQIRGSAEIALKFKSKLKDLKSSKSQQNIFAEGEVSIDSLDFRLKSYPFHVYNTSGDFVFNKNDLSFSGFKLNIDQSDFVLTGIFKNVFSALLFEKGRLGVIADVSSKQINVEEILEKFVTTKTKDTTLNNEFKNANFPYLEKYYFDLNCNVANLIYKKFNPKKIKCNLVFDQPTLILNQIDLAIAGGKFDASGKLYFKNESQIQTDLSLNVSDLVIDSLFNMMDNFGQEFIKDENLKGEFTGQIETYFVWDKNGNIDAKSIIADVDCDIKKGQLVNFSPMLNLSKFVDANELANVTFDNLTNKLFIEKETVYIPEMLIKSNIGEISIAGSHTFSNRMDYKISFPLKNLKHHKVDKDKAFGAIEDDNHKGAVLYVTLKGTADDYKIAYDSKKSKSTIKETLKNEKKELLDLFRKKQDTIKVIKPNELEFFDFE